MSVHRSPRCADVDVVVRLQNDVAMLVAVDQDLFQVDVKNFRPSARSHMRPNDVNLGEIRAITQSANST